MNAFAPYGYASSVQYWARSQYTAKEQETRLKIDLTRLRDDAAPVTNPPSLSSCMKADKAL